MVEVMEVIRRQCIDMSDSIPGRLKGRHPALEGCAATVVIYEVVSWVVLIPRHGLNHFRRYLWLRGRSLVPPPVTVLSSELLLDKPSEIMFQFKQYVISICHSSLCLSEIGMSTSNMVVRKVTCPLLRPLNYLMGIFGRQVTWKVTGVNETAKMQGSVLVQ